MTDSIEIVKFIRVSGILPGLMVLIFTWVLNTVLGRFTDRLGQRFTERRLVLQQTNTVLRFLVSFTGIAGAIMSPMISVDPQMGVGFLIPAFLSVLVGGLNSLLGAVVGAGTIGGTTGILSANMEQADAQIVVFLIAEPHGLAQLWRLTKEKLRLWPFPY